MPAVKPKLEKLSTPLTATFPSEIASATTPTPLSAVPFLCKPDPDSARTPISPPMAYTDFLTKAMSLNSPAATSDSAEAASDSASSGPVASEQSETDFSPPTSATTAVTATTSGSGSGSSSGSPSGSSSKASTPTTASAVPLPASPYASAPLSAPPAGAASFPSLKLPPSPAVSNLESPLSASAIRSPFSARSVHSVFDWDAALKARLSDLMKHKPSRTSVRHIREVVTRTVTYTPIMDPAPRGKRRKVD